MSHYAIELKYNFNQDSSEGGISEYFIPFTRDELLLYFELDKKTKKALENIEYTTEYILDDFVERCKFDNLNCLVLIDDNKFIELTERKNSNDNEVIYNRVSLWDLLSEANLMYKASIDYLENTERINQLAKATVYSQNELLAIKLQISLLVYFEFGQIMEMQKFKNESYEEEIALNNIDAIYNLYRTIDECNEDDELMLSELDIASWRYACNRQNEDICSVGNTITEICELCVINNGLNISQVQRHYNFVQIRTLNKKIYTALWKNFEYAYNYYKLIDSIVLAKRTTKNVRLLGAFVNGTHMIEQYDNMYAWIKNSVASFDGHSSSISSGYYGNINNWNDFSGYFSNGATSYISGKFSGKNSGCFALLFTDTDKHYFALSGLEELKPGAGKLAQPVKYIMEHILNKVSTPDIFAHNYTFNFAYLNHNLDVRRYTEIVKDGTDYIDKVGPYLSGYFETYDKDYINNPSENYGYTYGCCERKMLAYSKYDHAVRIFSRWAPCWKCCPAIIDAPKVEVYAFAKSSKDTTSSISLKRYEVERKTSYSVKIV